MLKLHATKVARAARAMDSARTNPTRKTRTVLQLQRVARAWVFRKKMADSLPDVEETLRKHAEDINKNRFVAGVYVVRIEEDQLFVKAVTPVDERQIKLFEKQNTEEVIRGSTPATIHPASPAEGVQRLPG